MTFSKIEEKSNDYNSALQWIVFKIDLDLNLLFLNQNGHEKTGYNEEDVKKGLKLHDVFPPEDTKRMSENLKKMFQGEKVYDQEYTVVKKNGHALPLRIFILNLERKGDSLEITGIAQDITEEKRLRTEMLQRSQKLEKEIEERNAELRENEAKYRFMTENMHDIIWTMDMTMKTTFVSPSIKNILGFTPEERYKQPIEEQITPDSLNRSREALFNELLKEGSRDPDRIVLIDIEYYHKDGSTRWCENLISGIRDNNGNLTSLLGVSRDITEKRLYEQRTKKLKEQLFEEQMKAQNERKLGELKTRFMRSATHEIRTPLTSILGYIELIEMTTGNGDYSQVKDYLGVIKRNSERLSSLTNDLLDLQKLESESIALKYSSINASEYISEIINEITPLYIKKDIKIVSSVNPDLEIYADRARIQQVLLNLIVNAIKFSDEGSTIMLDAGNNGNETLFSIADEGIGLRKEDLSKLFTPFPDIESKSHGKGTGLGLSICKKIIDVHGGDIWAESEGLEKGCVFKFTLPNEQH